MELLEEARLATLNRSARYQQTLCWYHERRIRERTLQVGDLVLRRVMPTKDKHKLSPPWEGPYTIAEVIRPGTFILKDSDGNTLTNTWNIEQLCRFFPIKSTTDRSSAPTRPLSAWSAREPDTCRFFSPHTS
jgi:hypothetical protein